MLPHQTTKALCVMCIALDVLDLDSELVILYNFYTISGMWLYTHVLS